MDTFTFYEESLHATQAAQVPFITALVQGRARGGASGSRRHGALPGASPSHRSARPTAEDLRRDRADAPGIAARTSWGHALDAVVVLAEELEVTARVERAQVCYRPGSSPPSSGTPELGCLTTDAAAATCSECPCRLSLRAFGRRRATSDECMECLA